LAKAKPTIGPRIGYSRGFFPINFSNLPKTLEVLGTGGLGNGKVVGGAKFFLGI